MSNSMIDSFNEPLDTPKPATSFKAGLVNAEHKIARMTRDATDKVTSIADNISNTGEQIVESSRQYVRQNPIKTVAVAATVGAAAGSLATAIFSWRRSKRPQSK